MALRSISAVTVVASILFGCGGGSGDAPQPSATNPVPANVNPPASSNPPSTTVPPTDASTTPGSVPSIPTPAPVTNGLAPNPAPHVVSNTPFKSAELQPCIDESNQTPATTLPLQGIGIKDIRFTNSTFSTPVSISELPRTTLLGNNGVVYVLGSNVDGAIGVSAESRSPITTPTPLAIDRPIIRLITASVGIDIDGAVWYWHTKPWTASETVSKPIKIEGLTEVIDVKGVADSPFYRVYLLTKSGKVWGITKLADSPFIVGDVFAPLPEQPVLMQGMPPLKQIAVTNGALAGVTSAGQLWTWSTNSKMLGRASVGLLPAVPAPIPNLPLCISRMSVRRFT
jgi:hypothetical protein